MSADVISFPGLTGNDSTFDMDASLGMAAEFGLALVDKYLDEIRGLAATGQMLHLPDHLDRFGASCETFIQHVIQDAVFRGASQDEARLVAYALCDASKSRLAALAEGLGT